MGNSKKILLCLSPQVHEKVNRVCALNFENLYREWKGYFNAYVQWLGLFRKAIYEIVQSSETIRKSIHKVQLLGGELGSCNYKIILSDNATIISIIDVSFNSFNIADDFYGKEYLTEVLLVSCADTGDAHQEKRHHLAIH